MSRPTRGIGKLHPLTDVLVAHGFTVRDARRVINALFDTIKGALQRHETVVLPFGTLTVESQPIQPYRRWSHGRPVEFYQRRYRVVFTPHQEDDDNE